jgi:hypothetical protein
VSIEATRWVLKDVRIPEEVDARQRPHLRFLLLCLADHAGHDGRNAFPSLATLGNYTEMSRSTIIRGLDKLEELGFIKVGSQAVVQAYTERRDRIPKSYDLVMDGVSYGTGKPNGVSQEAERGVIGSPRMTPKPSLEPRDKPPTPDAAAPGEQEALIPAPQKPAVDEENPSIREINKRATVLAQEHYERLNKMGNVPAFMRIIKQAVVREFPDEAISRALAYIAENNWTLTAERLANTLRGGPKLPTRRPEQAPQTYARTRNGMRIE